MKTTPDLSCRSARFDLGQTPLIIFSVPQGFDKSKCGLSADDVNHRNVQVELARLNIPFEVVRWAREGKIRFAILLEHAEPGYSFAIHTATEHKQQSILLVDKERNAFLYYPSTDYHEPLGTFSKISLEHANALDGWLYAPASDQFWGTLR